MKKLLGSLPMLIVLAGLLGSFIGQVDNAIAADLDIKAPSTPQDRGADTTFQWDPLSGSPNADYELWEWVEYVYCSALNSTTCTQAISTGLGVDYRIYQVIGSDEYGDWYGDVLFLDCTDPDGPGVGDDC